MKPSKPERLTRLIELVETGNIAVSLRRIHNAPQASPLAWKRALYHAIGMTYIGTDHAERTKIREALGLP